MLKVSLMVAVLSQAAISRAADRCHFVNVKVTAKTSELSELVISPSKKILLEGASADRKTHEGPLWLEVKGKKVCKIDGGIFSDIYLNRSANVLLVKEYSGSCGQHRILSLKDCSPIGEVAEYCGDASILENKLVNEPPCEPLDMHTSSCSSGKVFNFSKGSCGLKLDPKASVQLTKKKLGVELPIDKKSYKVLYPGTPKAALGAP
ncbi:hypothetical protein QJS83_14995 [Bdellovibrio sp. 22V]|uniref:hypothetical protein n=1 Tax=Bdellovibrio sp. 22V TaxID=3044166 RepID=UPI002542A526|nr:hypothetical protein [Bdellovibrio sp. 22V]WII71770.1 hypothetical protein QJS83_14995 [Bdellovibrio sp. 22V]